MSTSLVIALIVIVAVLGWVGFTYVTDAPFGIIGVFGGGAIFHFQDGSSDRWAWSLLFTLLALLLFVIGMLRDTDSRKGSPWFWAALVVGLFGSLLPKLVEYKWSFNPGVTTIHVGWLLLFIALGLAVFVMKARKKKSTV